MSCVILAVIFNLEKKMMTTSNLRMKTILSIISLLLLVPFIAMQFTNEVNWTVIDFVVMGGLLLFFGFTLDFLVGEMTSFYFKIILGIGIVLIFLLIWAELAVGIVGTPFAGS